MEQPRKFRILYIGRNTPMDPLAWSGIPYWLIRRLRERGHHVDDLIISDELYFGVAKFSLNLMKIFGKYFAPDRTSIYHFFLARRIRKFLRGKAYDVIFCQNSIYASACPMGRVVFWTDAELEQLYTLYWPTAWKGWVNRQVALRQEHLAGQTSSAVIFASKWAKDAAVGKNIVDESKATVIPFMPNLVPSLDNKQVRQLAIQRTADSGCKMLFIGADWLRKGGAHAIKLVEALRESGVDATLTIIGASPYKKGEEPGFVTQLGFLNKSVKRDLDKTIDYICQSNFLVLPSLADCSSIVSIEASAFGLPTVASRIGGVPELIMDGVTGILSDFNDIIALSNQVRALMNCKDSYYRMRIAARARYVRKFSPDVSIRRFEAVFSRLDYTAGR